MILKVYLVILASLSTLAIVGIGYELGRIKHMMAINIAQNLFSDKIIEALNKEEEK